MLRGLVEAVFRLKRRALEVAADVVQDGAILDRVCVCKQRAEVVFGQARDGLAKRPFEAVARRRHNEAADEHVDDAGLPDEVEQRDGDVLVLFEAHSPEGKGKHVAANHRRRERLHSPAVA